MCSVETEAAIYQSANKWNGGANEPRKGMWVDIEHSRLSNSVFFFFIFFIFQDYLLFGFDKCCGCHSDVFVIIFLRFFIALFLSFWYQVWRNVEDGR